MCNQSISNWGREDLEGNQFKEYQEKHKMHVHLGQNDGNKQNFKWLNNSQLDDILLLKPLRKTMHKWFLIQLCIGIAMRVSGWRDCRFSFLANNTIYTKAHKRLWRERFLVYNRIIQVSNSLEILRDGENTVNNNIIARLSINSI